MLKAAESEILQEIFNIGSGEFHTINELVELIGGDKIYIPKRPGEPDITHADITKIQKELGWQPKISFEEGVKFYLKILIIGRMHLYGLQKKLKKLQKTGLNIYLHENFYNRWSWLCGYGTY